VRRCADCAGDRGLAKGRWPSRPLAIYANGAATQTYTYDANGNRASYLDNATPPVSLAYNIDPASNRLVGIGGSWAGSFTYDAGGNMLSYSTPYSGYSFAYDVRNRQTEASVGAIGTSFLINGLGQRIAQTNGSVPQFFFVYDEASHLSGKFDGGGNLLWETAWRGGSPAAALKHYRHPRRVAQGRCPPCGTRAHTSNLTRNRR
jgi:YD repeat-containing protein